MKTRIVVIVLAALLVAAFVADKVLEAVVRARIERLVEGSGVELSMGRVAVDLPRRSVSVRGARVKLQHNDDTTSPTGLVAMDATIDLIEARGIRLRRSGPSGGRFSARSLEVDLSDATAVFGSALVEMGPAKFSITEMKTAAALIDSLAVAMDDDADKTRIALHGLTLAEVDVAELLAERRTIKIDSVAIERAVVASNKNRKVAVPVRSKPLLWQAIQRLPVAVDIPLVRCADLDATYREMAAAATEWGEVTLRRGRLRIENLTNIASRGRFMAVELAATLMGTGEMALRAQFPVDPLDNHFEMAGRIGRSSLPAFNRAVEPMTGVKIDRGELQSLDFRVEGTNAQSNVRLTMLYDGLAVEMVSKTDHHRRALASWALNDLLVRDANPASQNGRTRIGEGVFERDTTKSTFNYLWKSLTPGIKKTVL